MDGAALAAKVRAQLKEEVAELGALGLATVLVGDDPASQIYIRLKHEAADEVGIRAIDNRLAADAPEEDVLELVGELNDDDAVDGILVQTPLPAHIDEAKVMRTIDPMKDVDGLHPFNAGQLYSGRQTLVPATPVGIMQLLDELDELLLRGIGRQSLVDGTDPHIVRRLVLQPDVDLGRGVVADEHGREAHVAELSDLLLQLRADLAGDRGAVYARRRHLERHLDVADVEAERLGQTDPDLEVLLQALHVARLHRSADPRALAWTPEGVRRELG